ncbi:hypothetical protein TNCV_2015061 [Trichonephila clavipes]|nr:hypothetical protein TNCV_2015061 [Trichonephila clavipes]
MNSWRETSGNERALVIKWSKDGKSLQEIASLIRKSPMVVSKKYYKNIVELDVRPTFQEEGAKKLSDGQYKVWRQVGKELDPKNTIKTVKYGGGSVLV